LLTGISDAGLSLEKLTPDHRKEQAMNVLCPVDGSDFSQWAVESLGALDRSSIDSLTLLHVVDTHKLKVVGAPRTVSYRGATAALEKAGAEILKRAKRQADVALSQSALKPRTKIKTVMVGGSPAASILRRAAQDRAHLLVMGTRGSTDMKGFLLGSVCRKVSSLAPCPVLVVKQPLKSANRVLLAVDGSKHSKAAARFLRSGFLPESTTITILTSVETPVTDLAARYLSEAQLEELKRPVLAQATELVAGFREEFIKEGYTVTTEVQMDHVIDTIVKFAAADQTDLLVVGSRGLSGRERLHLGSVSESLLKYAPCSVLIVRGARA
jgi:nucleotide-binding universal stress UspA family protein